MSRLLLFFLIGFKITHIELQKRQPKSFDALIKETQLEISKDLLIRYPERKNNIRRQRIIPKSVPFPCANQTRSGLRRSVNRPTSVHKLRPGDIDIIGAMGDSLIAGSGALEEWALGNMIEYRGVSWCIGGQETWRTFLTLPNILKEFNPNLTGYSIGTGEFFSSNSRMNVAFPIAADADALKQAKVLVKRLKQLKEINAAESWKMITIFFGANDLCSAQCYDKNQGSPKKHAEKLMAALDYLQEHLPRTFVNLIPVLDVSVSVRVKRTMMCRFMHVLYCTCFHRSGNDAVTVITNIAKEYQRTEEILVSSGRYDKRDDFTVVLQPFIKLFNTPNNPSLRYNEAIDESYITYDCFHFSQKGHALAIEILRPLTTYLTSMKGTGVGVGYKVEKAKLVEKPPLAKAKNGEILGAVASAAANLLWNNLLQPVGGKSIEPLRYIMEKFSCPSKNIPYLFTAKNSVSYYLTGHQ